MVFATIEVVYRGASSSSPADAVGKSNGFCVGIIKQKDEILIQSSNPSQKTIKEKGRLCGPGVHFWQFFRLSVPMGVFIGLNST